MDIVVAYDIATESPTGRRRLRKVAQLCLNYGQRVQYSVFECRVSEIELHKLKTALLDVIIPREDNVRIYRLSGPHDDCVWSKGINRYVDFDNPLIF